MPTPRSFIIDGGPVPIHCLEWPGPGNPVLLIHGTSYCAAIWSPVAEHLVSRYRVVAMDMRGHGDSGKPVSAYATADFVADLLHVVDQLRLEGATVLAHSLGANVALAGFRKRLGLFSKAVLIEPAFMLRPEHLEWMGKSSARFRDQSQTKSPVWPDRETMFQAYRKKPIPSTWREDALRAYIQGGTLVRDDGMVELKCSPDIEKALYRGDRQQVIGREELQAFTLPILLIRGERTPRAIRSMIDGAAPLLPNARLVIIPGATHFVPMEAPEEIARLTDAFVRG